MERRQLQAPGQGEGEARIARVAREWTATFDTMPDQVAIVDRRYRIRRANRSLARFLGTEPREIVGRRCFEAVHGRSRPWPGCPHREALRRDDAVTREIEDAERNVVLLVTCTPFRDGDGDVVGTVHVGRDVSEQRRGEEVRQLLIAELQLALSNVRLLSGLLPICACCKKIRDDQGAWRQIEEYIRQHSEATFTHGICPDCAREHFARFLK